MRLIIDVIAIILFFIFSLVLFPIAWLIGRFSSRARDMLLLRTVQGFMKFLLFLSGTHLTIRGKEYIPADAPVLYIINHRSLFDILVTYCTCPGPTGYIAKKEIAKVPVLNLWITQLHGLYIDREDLRQSLKIILRAIEQVKNGISIAIFPEGTRGKDADETQMLPFHEGSFKISQKTGCPVIPVCISHTSRVLEDHFPWVRSADVTVEYLPPVIPGELTGDDKKFMGKYVQGLMQEKLKENA